MSKKILVEINVKQEITYSHQIEIAEDEYNKLKEFNGDSVMRHEKGYHDIEAVVDTSSVYDDGGEWLDFEINKVEEE